MINSLNSSNNSRNWVLLLISFVLLFFAGLLKCCMDVRREQNEDNDSVDENDEGEEGEHGEDAVDDGGGDGGGDC